jgi:hypothetical protein
VFWVISVYFNIRNILPKSGTFLLGHPIYEVYGSRGGTVVKGTALQIGRSLVRFLLVSLEFFSDIILPVALWPWG